MSVDENTPGYGAVSRARDGLAALETLAAIRAGARTYATADEQEKLRRWPGWGPLTKWFKPDSESWAQMAERAAQLLSEADLKEGHQGTYQAFFTPASVADAMWAILDKLGFDGGDVAELGCGAGVFMETAPRLRPVRMTGVERDPTSAAIAKLLHPEHDIVQARLQDHPLPAKFAAVIGNVPFGDVKIFDPTVPYDHRQVCKSLHHYFMYRAIKALLPGGVAVLLTSRHTMDGFDPEGVRKYLTGPDGDADFLGAIRLPAGGLGGGTDIVSDIIVLRRRVPATRQETRPKLTWLESSTARFGHGNPVNEYWAERPGFVLGAMNNGKTSQYGLNITVEPIAGESAATGIRRVTDGLVDDARTARLMWERPVAVDDLGDISAVTTPDGWWENSYHLVGRTVMVVKDGRAAPKPAPKRELVDLIKIKALVKDLVEGEANHDTADEDLSPLRRRTAAAYKRYVTEWGPLNRYTILDSDKGDGDTGGDYSRRYPSMGGFRHDPDWPLVAALGIFDDETRTERPAEILFERQNRRTVRPERTDDPREALAWSLDRTGRVDLDYIARLLGKELPELRGTPDEQDAIYERIKAIRAEVAVLLGDGAFEEPDTGEWVPAEEYLSGDVRQKLRTAQAAATDDPAYQRNVDALTAALPKWLGPDDIIAALGAPWIGASDIRDFLRDTLGHPAVVRRMKESNKWDVTDGFKFSTAAQETWGTPHWNAYDLVEAALNGKTPVVKDKTDAGTFKNEPATMAACEAQTRLKQRFAEWVWEDAERADRLAKHYNETHNCLVPRAYNGDHITVEGMAPSWAAKLYPHQRGFIARAMATPATLCALPVGAGKSVIMTATAIKLKQVGLIRKGMLVVPNHLLGQADAEARRAFPAAKILSSGSTEISANRRAFAARVATQDWDLVIVTQAAFDRMPVHPETEQRYQEMRLDALHRSLIESDPDGKGKGREIKAMAKRLDRLVEDINELQHRARGYDVGVTFEQLGIDWVGIDEAHAYKNLAVACTTDGFNIAASKRALRLDMKLRWLAGRSPRHAALFTGTPVSNSMIELYVMMQYLMPDYLDSIDLGSADAWCAAFVQMETKVGVTVDGGRFEMQTKPSQFINAPELRVLFARVADIRTADQLGLKRPLMDERIVKIQPTEAQTQMSENLVRRAKACKGKRFPKPGEDNMLKVCNDGRWGATDPHLIGIRETEPYKLHAVAEQMIAVWREHPDELQLGFLDVGTPDGKGDDQSYGRLTDLLVDMGMPRNLIAYAHDAKTNTAKAALFKRANAGPLAVLLGSTGKLGTGTNVQDRVVAMHNVDAPYTPSGVEQRDGRGLRPGNRNKTVIVFRYVTARTFDSYLWQMLVRKLGFIQQMNSGNLDRTVKDCSSDQLITFSAVQASATDQPLLMERAAVEAKVNNLQILRGQHDQKIRRNRQMIPMLEQEVAKRAAKRAAWQAIADAQIPEAIDKELAEALHEQMGRHRYYSTNQINVGSLIVTFGTWRSNGDQPQPMLQVDGGAGYVEEKIYENYKGDTIGERVLKVAGRAGDEVAKRTSTIDRVEQDIDEKRALLDTVFEKQAELVTAETRLAQIDNELKEQASGGEQGESVTVEHNLVESVDDKYAHLRTGACSCGGWKTSGSAASEVVKGWHAKHVSDESLRAKIEAGAGTEVNGRVIPDQRPAPAEDVPWVTITRVTPPEQDHTELAQVVAPAPEPEPTPEPEPARVVTIDDLDTGDDDAEDAAAEDLADAVDKAVAKAFTDPESMSRDEEDAAAAAIFAAFIPAPEPEPEMSSAAAAAMVQAFMEAADREAAEIFARICG